MPGKKSSFGIIYSKLESTFSKRARPARVLDLGQVSKLLVRYVDQSSITAIKSPVSQLQNFRDTAPYPAAKMAVDSRATWQNIGPVCSPDVIAITFTNITDALTTSGTVDFDAHGPGVTTGVAGSENNFQL